MKCMDCNTSISAVSKRCLSCWHKFSVGPKASNYRTGSCCAPVYCLVCGKKLFKQAKYRGFQYCRDHAPKPKPRGYGVGSRNNAWKGGISKLPYSFKFNEDLKKRIRKRDNYTCQGCGLREENHYRELSIHHINYNKMNCKSTNLITVCTGCNSKANFSRDYWFAYYTYLIEEKYIIGVQ